MRDLCDEIERIFIQIIVECGKNGTGLIFLEEKIMQ